MCIYYTKRKELHYDSAEHIIPAAIGGIARLPKEYVSREFNTNISGLEQDFIREGMIALVRPLVGPGKRGSLSEKKATKSKIQVIRAVGDEVNVALGYSRGRKTIEIPHLKMNTKTGESAFNCSELGLQPGGAEKELQQFKSRCVQADGLRVKILEDSHLPVDVILLGIADGIEENYNCFFAKNPANPLMPTTNNLQQIGQGIRFIPDIKHSQYQPIVHGNITFKMDHLRIYGKIAFNFLASLIGADLARLPAFDVVRTWIAEGGTSSKAILDPTNVNPLTGMEIALPDYAHIIYLVQYDRLLVAKVFLYGGFSVSIVLTEDFRLNLNTDGLICDWRNQKEYRLREFLVQHVKQVNERLKENKVNPFA